ncbi:MAG: type I-E CRISPR-associated protein Cas5/CasD, partial [bacterium]|nr:type I-E CRISPR-associated protein Cas5/CasD [bacterium]
MSVLLIRLAGPMQSWDTQSRFTDRHSGREPSKSGVIGLLCAAMGKPREEKSGDGYPTLATLANLKMGVRIDREGTVAKDYHTVGCGWSREMGVRYAYMKLKPVKGGNLGVATADGKARGPVTSNRYYLADANFLVGLEGDIELLRHLDNALAAPVWPLFLGRKSFVPGLPVWIPHCLLPSGRLIKKPLEDALRGFPWFPRQKEIPQ